MFDDFVYQRRVAYCDTDAMAVVHHSNYLRYFEEARVAWLREREVVDQHFPHTTTTLAVIETGCSHFRPARFDDLLRIRMQTRREGLKIRFRYAIFVDGGEIEPIATGFSLHVPINEQFKVCRVSKKIQQIMEQEQWTETWP